MLLRKENDSFKKVVDMTKCLELQPTTVDLLTKTFEREINFGLSKDGLERRRTAMPMIKTFITDIPNGLETGVYLGVDLGGTNFRIIMAVLNGEEQNFITEVEPIPHDLFHLPCQHLYDYMAAKLAYFLEIRGLKGQAFKLGYTFSFPAITESMRSARLVTWTKGFNCPDGIGEDCGKLFQEAINRHGDLNVELVCVTNDTTAALLAGTFIDQDYVIGVVLGTGSNAAYYQDLKPPRKFGEKDELADKMIVNMEWGAFGDNGSLYFLRTPFDEMVDGNSLHPGSFTFEKMFSGLYYGELFRVVLSVLAEHRLFLRGTGGGPDRLPAPWQLNTVAVSAISADPGDGVFPNTIRALKTLGLLPYCTEDDWCVAHYVGRLLTRRSADIVAAACATLVKHIGRPEIGIAFDGSYYQHLPGLSQLIEGKLMQLCPNVKIKTSLVIDGSGRGGAIAAAMADRNLKREVTEAVQDIVSLVYCKGQYSEE